MSIFAGCVPYIMYRPEEESVPENPDEQAYLQLLQEVIDMGEKRNDRTGVGSRAVFGRTLTFDLSNQFPLLTTKFVPFRTVAEELLWFVRGETDVRRLKERGVHIWDFNTSRDYLDRIGLHQYPEGDAGPIYGFQWRHFGAHYRGCDASYAGEGVDQLAQLIEKIQSEPDSRRLVLSAWNPVDIPKMALPPCHFACQFFVSGRDLKCLVSMRSADLGLGAPFNIASYALLTHIVAQVCGLRPRELTLHLGVAHVYENHVQALKEQISRAPYPFPRLRLDASVKGLTDFGTDSFTLENYQHHPKISLALN